MPSCSLRFWLACSSDKDVPGKLSLATFGDSTTSLILPNCKIFHLFTSNCQMTLCILCSTIHYVFRKLEIYCVNIIANFRYPELQISAKDQMPFPQVQYYILHIKYTMLAVRAFLVLQCTGVWSNLEKIHLQYLKSIR